MTTHKTYIVDTTLRDGEQAPGVVFTTDEKIKIADLLNQTGIEELEIGVPAMGKEVIQDCETINSLGFNFKTSTWSRATKADVDQAIPTKCDAINISFPVSKVQLEALGKDYNWVRAEMKEVIAYARDRFETVNIGAQDATRAELGFLKEYVLLSQEYGINRLRIADTVGNMNPSTIQSLISTIKQSSPEMELEFHGHNDLGMATANALTALNAGAESISTTVNGLGERAGNAATEEVVVALAKSYNQSKHYDLKYLRELSNFTAEASKRTLSESKPISGSMVLSHETGIHTRSIILNPSTYELLNPEELGMKSQLLFGKFSGTASIKHLFDKKGVNLCQDGINTILKQIKSLSTQYKRAYTETEVLEMFIAHTHA